VRDRAPDVAFAGLLALGAALVLLETRGLSFFADEWDFLLDRRGMSLDVLLRPHGPHLSLIPILVYKALLQLFGASSYLPFRLLAAVDLVLLALTLGLVTRARWGKWWGLAPVLLLVTLGPGGASLLSPFQVGYAVSVSAGLVALVAVARRDFRGDLIACLALLVSLASASQGIGFLVGTAVMLGLAGDRRRRAWLVVLPAALYAVWYLKYGHQASETQLALWKTSLSYAAQSLSATFAPLLGLSSVSPQTGLLDITFGVPPALAGIAAVAYASWRGWRPLALFWAAAAILLILWTAASLSNTPLYSRPPADPRYLSTNAVLLMVCVCVGVPRPKLALGGTIAACAALAVIAATNASQYSSARAGMLTSDVASRAELGALMLMRGTVSPAFTPSLGGDPAILVNVRDARSFFSFVDSFGAVTDSLNGLRGQSEPTRELADGAFRRGELSLSPVGHAVPAVSTPPTLLSATAESTGGCLSLGAAPIVIRAAPGRYELIAGGREPLTITLRRLATDYAVPLGSVPAGAAAVVRVPDDRAPQLPWQIRLTGPGGRACVVAS
jgi:hypothetical protein